MRKLRTSAELKEQPDSRGSPVKMAIKTSLQLIRGLHGERR